MIKNEDKLEVSLLRQIGIDATTPEFIARKEHRRAELLRQLLLQELAKRPTVRLRRMAESVRSFMRKTPFGFRVVVANGEYKL